MSGVLRLSDGEWVWRNYCSEFGEPEESPKFLRAIQLTYTPGARACVSYSADWERGQWVQEERFAVEVTPTGPVRLFRYPDDPYLPGLPAAASPVEADRLLARHASVSMERPFVEVMRYRPATRAVLRYTSRRRGRRLDERSIFVRVMPPARVKHMLAASKLAAQSGFDLPRLLGSWPEGGVVWLNGVEGETLRTRIQAGTPPDPNSILDGLEQLWSLPVEPAHGRTLDVHGGFRMTKRLLSQVLPGQEARRLLQQVTELIEPFAKTWRPSAIAHNDFHDDQLIVTPEGGLALIDFEEVGLGDPLLDVANLLAHLRWMARFGNASEACEAYHRRLQDAAVDRFDWDREALNLREAFVLFRLSSGPFRQLKTNWKSRVESALALAHAVSNGCGWTESWPGSTLQMR